MQALLELSTDEVAPLLEAVRAAGLPLPDPGTEKMSGGRVVAESEFEWPDLRLAIPLTEEDEAGLRAEGWGLVDRSIAPVDLVDQLRSAVKQRGE